MMNLNQVLVFVLLAALTTVDTRSVQQDSDIELLFENRLRGNKQLSDTISSYRHRLDHSPNFKAFRYALSQQFTPPYCEFCHLFVPAVSLIYAYASSNCLVLV